MAESMASVSGFVASGDNDSGIDELGILPLFICWNREEVCSSFSGLLCVFHSSLNDASTPSLVVTWLIFMFKAFPILVPQRRFPRDIV